MTGRSCARSRGIVLLEALIAVLILSLAMPGFLGLATRALQDAADAHWRSEAASLAGEGGTVRAEQLKVAAPDPAGSATVSPDVVGNAPVPEPSSTR